MGGEQRDAEAPGWSFDRRSGYNLPGESDVIAHRAAESAANLASSASRAGLAGRAGRGVVVAALALFLLANLAVPGHALLAALGTTWGSLSLTGVVIGVGALLARPSLVGPALELFAGSFFLYGFHSYRLPTQALELLVAAFALVLLSRSALAAGGSAAGAWPLGLLALYASLAAASLLILPLPVLEHRLFLEGGDFGRAVLEAFPKDPLYPIASVDRLWLFVLFAGLLFSQDDARDLYRRLFRGVAWAAVAAVVLGLLDFAGLVSLDHYNLSNLFFGNRYRRLQSTFGNPSWFACFVACALPFVLLRFHETRGRARWAMAVVFPLCGASLILSAARAAWLASLVLLSAVLAAALLARRRGRPLASMDGPAWVALAATLIAVGLIAAAAVTTPTDRVAPGAPVGRLEGLSREMQYRGLGLSSPRKAAAAYALELARLSPLLGLGYESFNMHLRALLEVPGSGIAGVANTAVAADPTETVFDDSHNTYLQVLTGTGAVGLFLWLATAAAGVLSAARAFRRGWEAEALAVFLGLVIFHFYGLFQGMTYVPVSFLLFPLLTGYAVALDPGPVGATVVRGNRIALLVMAAGLLAAAAGYASDTGYAGLKRRFGLESYLPDEGAVFEGFYRPETGPSGEFRWMRRRAIVNVSRAQPFRLRLSCEHPDAAQDPVVVSLRFEGREAGQVVFSRPGAVERRFDLGEPGTLRLLVSRTFRPAGDGRELGIAVSAILWE
jgi:O-antigen ligase